MFQQHRIRVVDVGVDAIPAAQLGKPFETAAGPRDGQMVHFPRGPVADTQCDQLAVLPKRTIEE
jgi:hypothetical protein